MSHSHAWCYDCSWSTGSDAAHANLVDRLAAAHTEKDPKHSTVSGMVWTTSTAVPAGTTG